jgi:Family of unknown function (DUF5985)
MTTLTVVLQAVAATAAWANGLFFLRFWRESRDPLFACFGVAFWLLAASWFVLASVDLRDETQPYVYGLRLVAFALLIAGIVVKNRTSLR